MIDYTTFTNTDGVAFPNTGGKNSTGAGAIDGTEYVKLFIDDIWGGNQALMDYAGLTPTGTQESAGASQRIEAIKKGFNVGPGIRVMYDFNSDPATLGYRFLPLNGQGILRATYADLDTINYVGDGNNAAVAAAGGGYYRADDAAGTTPNIAGVYLILPETRGYVPRGLDTAATVDPDGAARYLGDNQGFSLENITGTLNIKSTSAGLGLFTSPTGAFTAVGSTNLTTMTNNAASQPTQLVGFNASLTAATSTETRMANVSTNFGVGY